jgi:FixJ family two-component response regulator
MVFIIDDDDEVREAIGLLMSSVGLPVEKFDSARAYLDAFDPKRPGCLVLDVRMRGMSGLELQERLAAEPVHPPIVMITGHGDVPMAVRAVKAGAVDFLEKPFNDQQLLDAVHRAFELDARQRGEASQRAGIEERLKRLTRREREVLEQIVSGKRNKVIAADLGISQSTVEAHRAKVMEKLEAGSLSELMRMLLLAGNPAAGEGPAQAGGHPLGYGGDSQENP